MGTLNLTSAHLYKRLRFDGNGATQHTVSLPTGPTLQEFYWPENSVFHFFNNRTAGDILVDGQFGTTINSATGSFTLTPKQSASLYLVDRFANEWDLVIEGAGAGAGGGGIAEPANQIIFGTGSGADSSINFSYRSINGGLNVNTPNLVTGISSVNGNADNLQPALVNIYSPASPSGLGYSSLRLFTPSSGGGSDVRLFGGDSWVQGGRGGNIEIEAGTPRTTQGAGGNISITATDGNGTGAGGNVDITAGFTGTVFMGNANGGIIVENNGELSFGVRGNSNVGAEGQVLTHRAGFPPVWAPTPTPTVPMFTLTTASPSVLDGSLVSAFSASTPNTEPDPGIFWDIPGSSFSIIKAGRYKITVVSNFSTTGDIPGGSIAHGVQLQASNGSFFYTPSTSHHVRTIGTEGTAEDSSQFLGGPPPWVASNASQFGVTDSFIVAFPTESNLSISAYAFSDGFSANSYTPSLWVTFDYIGEDFNV